MVDAYTHELAEKIRAASTNECADPDCDRSLCSGAMMRHAADLIDPQRTT